VTSAGARDELAGELRLDVVAGLHVVEDAQHRRHS
jgi:hypothetical protein